MPLFQRLIPSMYQRRLLLLVGLMACATVALWARLAHLTVARGEELAAEAERALVDRMWLPTERGRIVDRKGRVLAQDSATYDVLVDYQVISGQWAYNEARKSAIRDQREKWQRLGFEEREALIAEYRSVYEDQLESMWDSMARLCGIGRAALEIRKSDVLQRVDRLRAAVWDRQLANRTAEGGDAARLGDVVQVVEEERAAHTLLENVPDEAATGLRLLAERARWPGLRIERSRVREYPSNRFLVVLDRSTLPSPIRADETVEVVVDRAVELLVGSMRDAWAQDMERHPFRRSNGEIDLHGYRDGDLVGSSGVEASMETVLSGSRGQLMMHKDSDAVERVEPLRGGDVHLTIDASLQARLMAIMDPAFGLTRVQEWHRAAPELLGQELYGSAVVIAVDSGEVLAMVSTPTPPIPVEGQPYPDLALDPNQPYRMKALQARYPPGSTIKPIIYAIAATERAIEWDQSYTCNGYLYPNDPDHYRCWIYRPENDWNTGHGELGPVDGISRSCNIYFFSCGRALGVQRITEQLHRWGLGVGTGIGFTGEDPGVVSPQTQAEATMVGIGQSKIAVTPLQMAAAHAALARAGFYRAPELIRGRGVERAEYDLGIPPRVMENALRGMEAAANDLDTGTASYLKINDELKEPIFNLRMQGLVLRGKTGTAQAPPQHALKRVTDASGRQVVVADRDRVLRVEGDHSWYILHVQKPGEERAAYIVVVMVEYGGSGGRVSGPIANQILYALKAEGYL